MDVYLTADFYRLRDYHLSTQVDNQHDIATTAHAVDPCPIQPRQLHACADTNNTRLRRTGKLP